MTAPPTVFITPEALLAHCTEQLNTLWSKVPPERFSETMTAFGNEPRSVPA